ncbi:MAG: glycoside hydrolase family 3 protein [Candidatus Aminicenantes bacterium]|nr:glycoside hydrolase family 3 protein [Candidatus Aminicenantes bacterium]
MEQVFLRYSYLAIFLIALILLSGCVPTPTINLTEDQAMIKTHPWVEKTLKKITLEEKIGQLFFVSISGRFFPADSDEMERLHLLIREKRVGGVILFGGEVYETAILLNHLQSWAKVPLLVASDLERGTGNQINGATVFPPLMALGAADSEELAYEMGRITALEARAVGIHQTYAPVVDVNINPDNPIINTRSVGEDPELVSRIACNFIRGCQENGLIATAKHFPGHGDTDLDSHTLLPVITADEDRLNKVEILPFRKAIEARVRSIMTAHLHVPALDPSPGLPATLSPLIISELLRKKLNFQGIIVTDALTMGGITRSFSSGEAAVRAIKAGVDCLLLPQDIEAAASALKEAVNSGEIPLSRLDESVRRLLQAKALLGLSQQKRIDLNLLPYRVGLKEYQQVASKAFIRAITLVKDENFVIPVVNKNIKIAALSLSSDPGDYYAGRPFIQEIEKRCSQTSSFYADAETGIEYFEQAKKLGQEADIIIIGLFSTLRAGKGSVGLENHHIDLVKEMASLNKPLIVISFGSPYFLRNFPEVPVYICAYRHSPQAQIAAVQAIFGEIEIQGKLPVSIPGLFSAGHGLKIKKIN